MDNHNVVILYFYRWGGLRVLRWSRSSNHRLSEAGSCAHERGVKHRAQGLPGQWCCRLVTLLCVEEDIVTVCTCKCPILWWMLRAHCIYNGHTIMWSVIIIRCAAITITIHVYVQYLRGNCVNGISRCAIYDTVMCSWEQTQHNVRTQHTCNVRYAPNLGFRNMHTPVRRRPAGWYKLSHLWIAIRTLWLMPFDLLFARFVWQNVNYGLRSMKLVAFI